MSTAIRTPVAKVRPGMVLAEPVFHPTSLQLLLNPGTTISLQNLSLLLRSGVVTVNIFDFTAAEKTTSPLVVSSVPEIFSGEPLEATLKAGEVRDYPGFGKMFKPAKPETSPITTGSLRRFSETRLEEIAKEVMARNFQTIRELGIQLDSGTAIDFERIDNCVQTTLHELVLNREFLASLADLRIHDEYTYAHSANVMSLSLVMGVTLGYSYEQLRALGSGAMLHDIGKQLIPDFVLNKADKLTKAEFELMKTHARRGVAVIKPYNWANSAIKSCILYHHERFDGTGYPIGLRGKAIPEMARITGICDVYDALISKRVYKAGMPPNQAYRIILNSLNILFEARMVWAFQRFIVPYPLNCLVVLNTGKIAKVRQVNRDDPRRPVVEVAAGKLLDLAKECEVLVSDLWRDPG
ncbi:MAG: HD-GYP domain-containing protein [Cyanobacteria bacterium NC_groundwater_1444_Ag_S-0.65um_54_12]|nr:HD-GYP domain-containing protein [Cyanobacteria bacterium NC_groundwater_1444_Ag_S-0.65um_54_12]